MTDQNQPEPRRVQHVAARTYRVPATPDEVWRFIATADGLSSWMVPTRLDPTVGGAVSFDLRAGPHVGVVTDYSPPTRFAFEEPWPIADRAQDVAPDMVRWFESLGIPLEAVFETLPHVTPVATEFLVEAESGGSSVIRVVTSAYGTGADWENEFFAEMARGMAPFFDRLASCFPVATS